VRGALAAGLGLALLACASGREPESAVPYRPDRRDYAAFASAWPDLLEPNYLPFMVHRVSRDDAAGDLLFFCRWPGEAMPLSVRVVPAELPDELQDEFAPKDPARYVEAVQHALATWEGELEGLVRFRLVDGDADLTVRLVAERAPVPEPDLQVLGSTPVTRACRVGGADPDAERLEVSFEKLQLRLFLADEFGLLEPDQIEWIALHEIGHALGMRGHSPIPADLMYEVARDRVMVHEGLSTEDVNSFVSLYQLPNGTIFGRVSERDSEPPAGDPGLPQLAIAPYVDSRLGFEFHPPAGWMRVPTSQGMVAVHGVTWDYTASFQIVVHRYPTIESYLGRYSRYYLNRGYLTRPAPLVVNGRRALQSEIEIFEAPRIEQITLIEVGDGRLIAIIADCPSETIDAYRPWFSAALASLEITELPSEGWPRR
jgi:predicted Zn-dependent protease